jgi:hypothetical protein
MTSQPETDKNLFQFHIIFIGMNPNRAKENVPEIRRVYLDSSASLHALRTSGDAPPPNFVLDTSPEKRQAVWRVEGPGQDQAESMLRSPAGILVAAAAVTAFLYYRNHVYVQVFAGPLNLINGNAVIEVYEENPDLNQDRLVVTQDLYRNGATRLRLPAADLILVVRASYADSQPREIRFPIFAASGLSLQKKRYEFHLPSDDEVRAHPRMAYVPRIHWLQGSDRSEQFNAHEFWIDLRPVTTEEYLPVARQLARDGRLEPFLSVLLTEENQSRAVESTNLKQTPKLMGQLQNVFDVINAESRATG